MWIKRFFLGLCAAVCAYLAVVMVTVMVRRGQDPSMELTALEEQWADWEPPAPRPVLCWMGWPIGGDHECPDQRTIVPRRYYEGKYEEYVRRNPQNPIFLRSPVDRWVISSYFGPRSDPFTHKKGTPHSGVDFDCDTGEPIYAAGEGQVIVSEYRGSDVLKKGYGNEVRINHGDKWVSLYGHLQSREVEAGQTVEAGQRIGTCGSTGRSTGSHLHFTVWRNGEKVDPLTVLPR